MVGPGRGDDVSRTIRSVAHEMRTSRRGHPASGEGDSYLKRDGRARARRARWADDENGPPAGVQKAAGRRLTPTPTSVSVFLTSDSCPQLTNLIPLRRDNFIFQRFT